MRRESCLAVVVLMLVGCPQNPNVTPNPVPSAERLRGEDCGAAADLYRQQLMVPRRSGTIVSSRLTVRSEQEQARTWRGLLPSVRGSWSDGRGGPLCAAGKTRPMPRRLIPAMTASNNDRF
jgi:hypothetical protein